MIWLLKALLVLPVKIVGGTARMAGATTAGLVFWISIALTGPLPSRASASPVRMRPICD